jgi:hypothetical protein
LIRWNWYYFPYKLTIPWALCVEHIAHSGLSPTHPQVPCSFQAGITSLHLSRLTQPDALLSSDHLPPPTGASCLLLYVSSWIWLYPTPKQSHSVKGLRTVVKMFKSQTLDFHAHLAYLGPSFLVSKMGIMIPFEVDIKGTPASSLKVTTWSISPGHAQWSPQPSLVIQIPSRCFKL